MGPKKKLSKKEKARIEAEQMELARIEMEKEKQRKLEEERERKQKEREEAEKRQRQEIIENQMRRKQLKESVLYFDEIQGRINEIKEDEKKKKEWSQYMRCNGAPNTYNPGDLRKYLYMWNTTIEEHNQNERNWLLKTDERTLLTQDPDVPNLSKEFLRQKQGNLGDMYAQRIRDIMAILTELDETLEDETTPESTIIDLLQLKSKFRFDLIEFIDDFTYKILSHIERNMESDTPGMAKHVYESDVFKSQVWAIHGETQMNQKDKLKDSLRHTEINFTFLGLQLSLPPSVKLPNSALRGLWLNFDHFSDYCASFRLPQLKREHLNILQQTKKEWKKRKEILQSTLDEANRETSIHSYDSQEQQEPHVVDVDKIYTEYEDELNKVRQNEMTLKMPEWSVNLRRYRIIGGVYCINYLDQPQQDKRLDAFSFVRTIIYPNKLKHKSFYQQYCPPPPPQPGVRRLPEEIEAEIKMIEQNLDKLAMMTVQLPDTVLWFEPPIVCRWESSEEIQETENPENSLEALKKNSRSHVEYDKNYPNILNLPVKEVDDFDLTNIPNEIDLLGLMTEFVVPRLPPGYCLRVEYREKETQEESSFKYLMKIPSNKDEENAGVLSSCRKPIKENLIRTGSPRPLYPPLSFNKIIKVKESPGFGRESQIIRRASVANEPSTTTEHIPYMFSELIEDLDELFEAQMPIFQEKIDEISSKMESEKSTPQASPPPPRRFSGIIIIRESDIQKDNSKNRKRNELDDEYDEESRSEYDDENAENYAEEREKLLIDDKHGRWSTRDVHDAKFNEDKLSIQFRTGRLGYFGFAANRYSNMPYQTWEIKPEMKNPGTISFSLTAAVISLEITITSEGVCINNFQGGTTEALTHIIGQTMPLSRLKNILATCAVDVFPEEDAFCYTEGSCEKNYVMEMHLYHCMSTLALSHNFSWSRWNLLSGSRTAVLLMRELLEGRKVPNHSTLYVTPLKAAVVDCTEVSASFNTVGVAGMEFYADLHHLAEAHAHPLSKEKRKKIDPLLMSNVAEILTSVRPLSFC